MSSFPPYEGKGEDEGGGNDGRFLAIRESGWCDTLVVVNMLQYIRCRDKMPSSRVTGGGPTPIGSGTCPRWL